MTIELRLKISKISENSIAESCGLREDDVLETYDGVQIHTAADLQNAIAQAGENVLITLFRSSFLIQIKTTRGALGIRLIDIQLDTDEVSRIDPSQVLVVTTPQLEGYRIVKYHDIISAECVFGMNFFQDLLAAITDIVGGRSETSQSALKKARELCMEELRKSAARLHANAVIGTSLDYSEFSGQGKSMLFLVASGTAVVIEKN